MYIENWQCASDWVQVKTTNDWRNTSQYSSKVNIIGINGLVFLTKENISLVYTSLSSIVKQEILLV